MVIFDSFLTVWIKCETMVGDSKPKSVRAHESSVSVSVSNEDFNEFETSTEMEIEDFRLGRDLDG